MIKLAMTKGRLERTATKRLEALGFDVTPLYEKGRKLVITLNENLEVVLAKAPDVITYVEHGVCDCGIVGKDTLMEHGGDVYELLDLGFGRCHFSVAVPDGANFDGIIGTPRIASKYPHVTETYFSRAGMDVDVIKIEGSVELAPLLGLSDAIVDIVETGNTLKENGLTAIRNIAPLSARLIANRAATKMKRDEVMALLEILKKKVD